MGCRAGERVPGRVGSAVRTLAKGCTRDETFALYRWFRRCCGWTRVPKFVQLIKWVQEQAGVGSARVRAPRLEIQGEELKLARRPRVFEKAQAERPAIDERPFADFAGA